jgi:hypothetical protein
LYRWIRDLHLYFGLFISPFILLFSASVFFLNHGKLPAGAPPLPQTVSNLTIPDGFDRLQGREAITRAREILAQLPLSGEIGFLRYVRKDRHLIFPVSRPGLEATVDVDLDDRTATVTERRTGVMEAMAFLHKMPGPHNVAIRGNWLWVRVWKWFADATIYLTLFISVSGVYLWYALKAERRVGGVLLAAGTLTFFGLIYAVIR